MQLWMAFVFRLDFQGPPIPRVNWELNAHQKELAKTDSAPSPGASKFFFHEHPESFPLSGIQILFSVSLTR